MTSCRFILINQSIKKIIPVISFKWSKSFYNSMNTTVIPSHQRKPVFSGNFAEIRKTGKTCLSVTFNLISPEPFVINKICIVFYSELGYTNRNSFRNKAVTGRTEHTFKIVLCNIRTIIFSGRSFLISIKSHRIPVNGNHQLITCSISLFQSIKIKIIEIILSNHSPVCCIRSNHYKAFCIVAPAFTNYFDNRFAVFSQSVRS